MRRFWIGFLAAILLPYVVTLSWSGSVGGMDPGNMGSRILGSGSGGNLKNGGLKGDSAVSRRILIQGGQGGYVEAEDYLVGVVARQIQADYELEAIKAQAIIARTYLYGQMGEAWEIDEKSLGLETLGENQMEKKWGEEHFLEYYNKIKQAVLETEGMVMVAEEGEGDDSASAEHAGEGTLVASPLFHQVSAGKTRDGDLAHPYLKSVESSRDMEAEGYLTVLEWEPAEIVEKLQGEAALTEAQVLENIQLVSREASGYVAEIQIGSHMFTGDQVRQLLGLPSAAFSLGAHEGKVRAVCKGVGHGYGLSQYGAHRLAQDGSRAEEILKYYFQNISVILLGNE